MSVTLPDAEGMRDTWANFDQREDDREQAHLLSLDAAAIEAAVASAAEQHRALWWAFVDEVKRTATEALVRQMPASEPGTGEGYYVVTYGGEDVHAGPFPTAEDADDRAAEIEAEDPLLITEVRLLSR